MVTTLAHTQLDVSNKLCNHCRDELSSSSIIMDFITGERVCEICGRVVDDEIIVNKDININSNLNSHINKVYITNFNDNKDINGRRIDAERLKTFSRLKKYDFRLRLDSSKKSNLNIAMKELDRLSTILHLPGFVKEKSAYIYRKTLKNKLIKGRSIKLFVAASVYLSCREFSLPHSLKTISMKGQYDYKKVGKIYRIILKETGFRSPSSNPVIFIQKICSRLKLTQNIELDSVLLLKKLEENHQVMGKNPSGIAAAIVYYTCKRNGVKMNQGKVAEAGDSSVVTLRKRLKQIKELV